MTPEFFTWSKHPRVRREVVRPPARTFDYGFTARRPLVPLSAVMLYLNLEQTGVMELIENGKLRWAFDIRREESEAREVRVLRESLFEYTGISPREDEAGEEQDAGRLVEEIVPQGTMLRPGEKPGRRPGWPISRPQRARHCPAPNAVARPLLQMQPVLLATEIANFFSCSAYHVGNLIREGLLGETRFRRRAPKASPVVLRSSVVEFLRARRIW